MRDIRHVRTKSPAFLIAAIRNAVTTDVEVPAVPVKATKPVTEVRVFVCRIVVATLADSMAVEPFVELSMTAVFAMGTTSVRDVMVF